jgi:pimeloyl-ACP methyl ester carboxylesterase
VQEDVDFQKQCMDVAESFLGETPVDVIGHSFGATVALRLAMEHPASVRRLVLIEPVLFCAAQETEAYDTYYAEFSPFMDAINAGDMLGAAAFFTGVWSDGLSWHDMSSDQQQGMADMIHIIPQEDPAIVQDNAGLLRDDWLERTGMPVLLIEGGLSPSIIAAVQDTLEARMPRTQRVCIDGAGHMAPLTHPEEVAEVITRFFGAD